MSPKSPPFKLGGPFFSRDPACLPLFFGGTPPIFKTLFAPHEKGGNRPFLMGNFLGVPPRGGGLPPPGLNFKRWGGFAPMAWITKPGILSGWFKPPAPFHKKPRKGVFRGPKMFGGERFFFLSRPPRGENLIFSPQKGPGVSPTPGPPKPPPPVFVRSLHGDRAGGIPVHPLKSAGALLPQPPKPVGGVWPFFPFSLAKLRKLTPFWGGNNFPPGGKKEGVPPRTPGVGPRGFPFY